MRGAGVGVFQYVLSTLLQMCLCSFSLSLQTSVFTPAFGSVTNVRVNSSMTTGQVLNLLLHKFRVNRLPNSNECRVLVQVYTWSHLVCCLWRWRINLRSLFFTWSTSLEVRSHFHCSAVRRSSEQVVVIRFLPLWSDRENPTAGWRTPAGDPCSSRTLRENLQNPHHWGRPGRGSHLWRKITFSLWWLHTSPCALQNQLYMHIYGFLFQELRKMFW